LWQSEQVQRVTLSGAAATVNWIAPQWQLPLRVVVVSLIDPARSSARHALPYQASVHDARRTLET
jgi:hypothetical protein